MITTAALKCSKYCLLLSETFVVNVLEWWKLHAKRTDINKCYTEDLSFVIFCTNWVSGETDCHAVPALHVHSFSRYLISNFRNLVKIFQRARFVLSISLQFNIKAFSSQLCRLTPRTENQCAPFCDYGKVHTKYMLNISLHFNPQPTPFTVTKYRHSIQLHILSVDTAI